MDAQATKEADAGEAAAVIPAEVEQPPAQEGPLALYPMFSLVDPRRKWQRIQDWAKSDSATAAAQKFLAESLTELSASVAFDESRSVDSSLLELELERARASMQRASLNALVAGGIDTNAELRAAVTSAGAGPGASAAVGASTNKTQLQATRLRASAASNQQSVEQVLSLLAAIEEQGTTARAGLDTAAPAKPLSNTHNESFAHQFVGHAAAPVGSGAGSTLAPSVSVPSGVPVNHKAEPHPSRPGTGASAAASHHVTSHHQQHQTILQAAAGPGAGSEGLPRGSTKFDPAALTAIQLGPPISIPTKPDAAMGSQQAVGAAASRLQPASFAAEVSIGCLVMMNYMV